MSINKWKGETDEKKTEESYYMNISSSQFYAYSSDIINYLLVAFAG